ncbi:MAG: DMT family transporter [Planctomycetes bacterium]|nr:DMT family transporter [Planctomycetota bacterium]MBM4085516.1 DMT family transporter [Planctomycetota bacterium]
MPNARITPDANVQRQFAAANALQRGEKARGRLGFVLDCGGVLFCALVWGTWAVAAQMSVRMMSVEVAGFWSRTFALIVLLLVTFWRGEARMLCNPGPVVKWAILIGVMAFAMNAAQLYGLRMPHASAANFSVIVKTDVLFTLLAARLFLKERMFRLDYAGVAIMALGVGSVILQDIRRYELAVVSDLLFLFAALALTFNAFVIKSKLQVLSNRVVAGYNCLMTFLGFLTLLPLTGKWGAAMAELGNLKHMAFLAGLGVLIAGVYLSYYHVLNRLPLWLVRVLLLFTPLFTMLLDSLIQRTKITAPQVVGACLLIAGACVIIIGHDRRTRFMVIESEMDS